ncbi:MAG TPA: hypothetical protein DCE42_15555 [Myxococcales bacterium]|nr:hypothetical protein [Deltaproteobacteria bacterium]HAA56180.1 hypothetical protein [Myxococcales bacterium]
MSHHCCSSLEHKSPKHQEQMTERCPACGEKGRKVGHQTIQSMLAISLEALMPASSYRFCRSPDCKVVYFSETEGLTFTEFDLREWVYQKHPEDERVFVCYCYQHTTASIREELLTTGETTIIEKITAGTKAKTCACDLRNPQGTCCLGNVKAVVNKIKEGTSQEKR